VKTKNATINTVGIKELRAQLSSYVETVSSGNRIVITDHGHEVALMVPVSGERLLIKSMIEAGRAHWSGGKPEGMAEIEIKGKLLSETILEERE
jgi:prevent-host-death family protein